jgi:hypothetical protein
VNRKHKIRHNNHPRSRERRLAGKGTRCPRDTEWAGLKTDIAQSQFEMALHSGKQRHSLNALNDSADFLKDSAVDFGASVKDDSADVLDEIRRTPGRLFEAVLLASGAGNRNRSEKTTRAAWDHDLQTKAQALLSETSRHDMHSSISSWGRMQRRAFLPRRIYLVCGVIFVSLGPGKS